MGMMGLLKKKSGAPVSFSPLLVEAGSCFVALVGLDSMCRPDVSRISFLFSAL